MKIGDLVKLKLVVLTEITENGNFSETEEEVIATVEYMYSTTHSSSNWKPIVLSCRGRKYQVNLNSVKMTKVSDAEAMLYRLEN